MYQATSTKPINYNAVYDITLIDSETVKILTTTNNGDVVEKEVVSKLQKLADLEKLKTDITSGLTSATADADTKIAFIDDITTRILEATNA